MQSKNVLYIICASGVTFVITLSVVALNRLRRKRSRKLKIQVVAKKNNENNTTNSNQEQDPYERVYDTIDESKMIDLPGQHQIQTAERSSDSSVKDEINLSDGYLNPYQPMVTDPDNHDYLKAKLFDEHDLLNYSYQNQDNASFSTLPNHNEQEMQEMPASVSLLPEMETELKRSDYVSMN